MQVAPVNYAPTLEELVLSAQNGEREAFNELVKRTHKMLRKLALPLLPASQVEDALQETYVIMYEKIHYLNNPGAFRPWLSRIALRTCYDLLRKRKPAEPLSLQPDQVAEAEEPLDTITLRNMLADLKKNDRNILILREYLEASYEEIAEILDLPPGTVKSRLFHARRKMKEIVRGHGGEH